MIGKLKGIIDSYGEDFVILDVNGVGYVVQCSTRTLQRLPKAGEAAAQELLHARRRQQLGDPPAPVRTGHGDTDDQGHPHGCASSRPAGRGVRTELRALDGVLSTCGITTSGGTTAGAVAEAPAGALPIGT